MEKLGQSKEFYNALWAEYLQLGDILTGPDTFILTILNRANALNEAFCELIKHEEDNRIAIIPLLRLQMDNLLYCCAGTLCEDFTIFMRCFMMGNKWTSLTDRDGNQLSEGYLVGKLCNAFHNDILKKIYEVCSEFIHLSNHHLYITLSHTETGALQQSVGDYYDKSDKQAITTIMEALNHYIVQIIKGSYFQLRREEMLGIRTLREQYPEMSDGELMQKFAYNHDEKYIQSFYAHLRTNNGSR